MAKLILLRHLQSQWNLENRFTGWVDVPLSKEGIDRAKEVAQKLAGIKIDAVYTSPLIRNQDTVLRVLECLGGKYPIFIYFQGKRKSWAGFKEENDNHIPVFVSDKLNERHYGDLQGLDKEAIKEKYGPKVVQLWRRSFKLAPPGGESLKNVVLRAIPFYKKYIAKDLKKGKNILLVASHNSLRAIVKELEKISDKDIINLEIEPGSMIEYEIDEKLKIKNKKIL